MVCVCDCVYVYLIEQRVLLIASWFYFIGITTKIEPIRIEKLKMFMYVQRESIVFVIQWP